MESFTYDDIYKIAEKRYPCPNGLWDSVAFTQAKIDAFIEGFQEAVKLGIMETNSNKVKESDYIRSEDGNWSTYYHL